MSWCKRAWENRVGFDRYVLYGNVDQVDDIEIADLDDTPREPPREPFQPTPIMTSGDEREG